MFKTGLSEKTPERELEDVFQRNDKIPCEIKNFTDSVNS